MAADNRPIVSTKEIRELLANRKVPFLNLERDVCGICLEDKRDITVRRFTFPCGHSFCMNCVCELYEIYNPKSAKGTTTIAADLCVLKECSNRRKQCPLCRKFILFESLLLDEDLSDVKGNNDGITFKILNEETGAFIGSFYVLNTELTITIALMFFFKVCVPIVNEYRCGFDYIKSIRITRGILYGIEQKDIEFSYPPKTLAKCFENNVLLEGVEHKLEITLPRGADS